MAGNGGASFGYGSGNTRNPGATRLVRPTIRDVKEIWIRLCVYFDDNYLNRAWKIAWFNGTTELGSARLYADHMDIELYTSTGTLQTSSSENLWITDRWNIIEVQVRIDNTTGLIKAFVNDDGTYSSAAASFSGDTQPGSETSIDFIGFGASTAAYGDDWAVNSITMNYDGGGGSFAPSVGDKITGGTSGAYAYVHADEGDGTSGVLVLYGWDGTAFQNNEVITEDGGSTTANVNAPDSSYDKGFEPNSWGVGDGYVVALLPSGAGTTTQLTASTGSNYQCVDEQPPNTTDYCYSSTTTQYDTYAMSDLPSTAATVWAVKSYNYCKKDGVTINNAKHVLRTASTNYFGTQFALATDWVDEHEMWNVNPNTLTKWTTSEANAMEHGFQVIT
jgi:hypothetical protein